MIPLKHYEIIFRRTTAGAVSLQLGRKFVKIDALRIDAFYDGGWATPFASLDSDLD